MSKGVHGGLFGKARRLHGKSRAERMYTQQLIEEFLQEDVVEEPERVVPVKPLSADPADSGYAYEFTAVAAEETAQSAEAARFDETVNGEVQVEAVATVKAEPNAPASAQTSAADVEVEAQEQPRAVDVSPLLTLVQEAKKHAAPRPWTASVQPKLFALRPSRRAPVRKMQWSGLAAGIAIGATAGAVLLGLLSLIV